MDHLEPADDAQGHLWMPAPEEIIALAEMRHSDTEQHGPADDGSRESAGSERSRQPAQLFQIFKGIARKADTA